MEQGGQEQGGQEQGGTATREWFVRMENIYIGRMEHRGFQHIAVMYASGREESTMGPLIDAIMYHYALPERVRPYLRIWTTPFRTNRLAEGCVIPREIEFLYVGV